MAEDAKAAKTQRLAEALRANLRRRKTAAAKAAQVGTESARPGPSAETTSGDNRG